MTMLFPALALLLASATDASALSLKVVSLDFAYPYYGEPGNTCPRGSVFVRAVSGGTPVVVRMMDSAGLTPGSEVVLEVRRAGKGKDGTPVYCSDGRRASAQASVVASPQPAIAPPPAEVPAATTPATAPTAIAPTATAPTATAPTATAPTATAPPASVPSPVPQAAAAPTPSTTAPATARSCTVRSFNVIKKALTDNTFGPSEFDPDSAFGAPEAVNCTVARSRVTNVLLLKMVKDRHAAPDSVVGAEWEPGSRWQRDEDAQRRTVKVYLVE